MAHRVAAYLRVWRLKQMRASEGEIVKRNVEKTTTYACLAHSNV